jgi:hypothetical protein
MKVLYWIFLGIDILLALIALFFFFWGLEDGTVSSFNMAIWLALLAGVTAVPAAGIVLKSKGLVWIANGVLLILALPGILAGIFFLTILITQPNWH